MASVYLVRHAESVLNAAGRAQGTTDPPLSDLGRDQAAALAHRLADVRFDQALTSDLARAVETAEAIVADRGPVPERTPALREIDYGILEGLTPDEAQSRHPDTYRQLMGGRIDFAPPGGEAMVDLLARVRPIADRLRSREGDEDDHVLVVGHGASLRALLVGLLELPADTVWRFGLDLASVSILDVHPDTVVLRRWNDTTHLAVAVPAR